MFLGGGGGGAVLGPDQGLPVGLHNLTTGNIPYLSVRNHDSLQ